MKILGLIRVLGCLAMCFGFFSSLGAVPFSISGAEAGAGPDAVKGEAEAGPEAVREEKLLQKHNVLGRKKIKGPPPLVHTEFYGLCATCHKPDGRGGRSYGGYAANLHETELELEGLIYFMKYGRPDMGMPSFDGVIGDRVMNAIANYIIDHFKGKPLAEGLEAHSRGAIDE